MKIAFQKLIGGDDSPSEVYLVGIIADSKKDAKLFAMDEVFIPKVFRAYDCTGAWSTSSLDLIGKTKFTDMADDGTCHKVKLYLFNHTMHCDV